MCQELARYIFGQYGERWDRNIERRPRTSNPRPGFAPDLDGKANIIGQIVMGKEQYAVYSSPSDVNGWYKS